MGARAAAERAALAQGLRAALVRAEPPAAGRRLVHGAAHERMAEAEAARHVGRAHEVEPQQLVERGDRRCVGHAGRGRRELGVERVAGDRRALEHEARRRATSRASSSASAAATRCGTWSPPSDGPGRARPARLRAVARARELLEVEGVAAALLVERVAAAAGRRPSPRSSRASRARQRAELEADERSGAVRALERGGEPLGHLARTRASASSTAAAGGRRSSAPSSSTERRVGPVQVVEHEHERLGVAASCSSSSRTARWVR